MRIIRGAWGVQQASVRSRALTGISRTRTIPAGVSWSSSFGWAS